MTEVIEMEITTPEPIKATVPNNGTYVTYGELEAILADYVKKDEGENNA